MENQEKLPKWLQIQNSRIESATDAIKTHGKDLTLIYVVGQQIIYPKGTKTPFGDIKTRDNLISKILSSDVNTINIVSSDDDNFMQTAIDPLIAFDEAFTKILRLEGRKIPSEEVVSLREKLNSVLKNNDELFDLAVELLVNAGERNFKNPKLRKSMEKKFKKQV